MAETFAQGHALFLLADAVFRLGTLALSLDVSVTCSEAEVWAETAHSKARIADHSSAEQMSVKTSM